MVDQSHIIAELQQDGGMELLATDGFHSSESNVLRVLGYFSLIGLLRVHSLIGDYAGAIKALGPLKVHEPRGLFARKIPGAFITLYYYAGFSYLMMRRCVCKARNLSMFLCQSCFLLLSLSGM